MKEEKEIVERPLDEIFSDVLVAREDKLKLEWSPEDLATDMLTVSKSLTANLEKYLKKGMDAPAKRVRDASKILETLSRNFRVQSTKHK